MFVHRLIAYLSLLWCASGCGDGGPGQAFEDADGGPEALGSDYASAAPGHHGDAGASEPGQDGPDGEEVASCRIDDGEVVLCLEWTGPTAQPISHIACGAMEQGKTYQHADGLCSREGALGSCTMLNQTELFYDEATAAKYRESCPLVHGGVWQEL